MTDWKQIRGLLPEAADTSYAGSLKAVAALDKADLDGAPVGAIHLLRNYTLEPIEPFLKLAAYRRGYRACITFSDYDVYHQEAIDPDSALYRQESDLIVLSLWLDNVRFAYDTAGRLDAPAVAAHVEEVVGQIARKTSAYIAVHTFLAPYGHADVPHAAAAIERLNVRLREWAAAQDRVLLADFPTLMGQLGAAQALDPRGWFLYKSPLKHPFLRLWAESLAQWVGSMKGCSRKVLVLDCDNTLWGGVIGEDGLEGIKLSRHDYPGNAYHTFHRQILALQRSGVLLALCSKNNEEDVMQALDAHPDRHLMREHLAAWRINWIDKAANIEAMAHELNLGLDAFVFVDDSPVECARVREALPMVEVLQTPQEVYHLPALLPSYNGFLNVTSTAEDSLRTTMYQAERERERLAREFQDLDAFIDSLQLSAEICPPLPEEIARVTQLTQKTNQFNLTTRRYRQDEIDRFCASEDHLVLAMKVTDRYGDYGLTGVTILARDGDRAHIDSFLMSCRILGRKLEGTLLLAALSAARDRWRVREVTAEYLPTRKNRQVADFYDRRGFIRTADAGDRILYVCPAVAEHVDDLQESRG